MAHVPADDAIFALALAAWWQLRRSAYLLPHVRKGPSSIGGPSDAGVLAWVKAIIAISTSITRRTVPTRRPAVGTGSNRPTVEVLDTVPMATSLPTPAIWDEEPTAPDLFPVGRWHPRPRPQPGVPVMPPRRPSTSIPRPRPAMDPPTSPSMAIGQAARGAVRPAPKPYQHERAIPRSSA